MQAVGELHDEAPTRESLRAKLQETGDVERLLSRAVLGTLAPREAAVLRDTLTAVPELLRLMQDLTASSLVELRGVDPVAELAADLVRYLQPDPAAKLRDGGVIADGLDDELDRVRGLATDSKKHVLAIERREREATGIQSLKVR